MLNSFTHQGKFITAAGMKMFFSVLVLLISFFISPVKIVLAEAPLKTLVRATLDKNHVEISYNSSVLKELPAAGPGLYDGDDEWILEFTSGPLAKIKIAFGMGASEDPHLSFYALNAAGGLEQIGMIGGEKFSLNGNEFAYSQGRMNAFFNLHRKWKISPKEITEVKQPLYAVGVEGIVQQQDLIITDQPLEGNEVARLPVGSPVSVVFAAFSDCQPDKTPFLVKTPFGLVGWVRIEGCPIADEVSPIKGIYFSGD